MKLVKPLTDNQKKAFRSYFSNQNLLLSGCPGTGKTFIAMYLALNDLSKNIFKKIIIIRSAVQSRNVGHLPGSLGEKLEAYERPYVDIVSELCERNQSYQYLKTKKLIEFHSTSFVRGLSWDDSIIILDEIQNFSDMETFSCLTRVGKNSKIIMLGDLMQNDLVQYKHQQTGMELLIQTCHRMKSIDIINFTVADIVRSDFVKEYLIARENI